MVVLGAQNYVNSGVRRGGARVLLDHYRAAKYLGHGVSIGDTRWSGGEQHIAVIGTLGPVTGAEHG